MVDVRLRGGGACGRGRRGGNVCEGVGSCGGSASIFGSEVTVVILLECDKVAVDGDCSGNEVEEIGRCGGKKDVICLEGTGDTIETRRKRFDCIIVSDCRSCFFD